MSITSKKMILSAILIILYGLLFFFQITSQLRLDFCSFYSSAIAYKQGINPYQCLMSNYYLIPFKLPANLNPPIFMQLMQPLSQLRFEKAASLWYLISFILGSIGALISFKITCSEDFFKKNWLILLFLYLAMYSTLLSLSIGQVGSILLFFIMSGYYCYLHKQDTLAGLFWGFIIAIKLFPALLFLFVLQQKRYKVFLITLFTSSFIFLVPFFFKGADIYSIYFKMLSQILWFGDNWNASIYGFLFRLFVDTKSNQNLWPIKISFLFFFIILLIWYIKKIILFKKTAITSHSSDHRAFCLTLVTMLLLSPMGWLYYFSLLIMPLFIIWQSLSQKQNIATSNKEIALWSLSVFLINFPIGYIATSHMSSILYKLSIYSIYFYGLLLIAHLVGQIKKPTQPLTISNYEENRTYLYPLNISLAIGLLVTIGCFIVKAVH